MSASQTVLDTAVRNKPTDIAQRELIVVLDRKVASSGATLGLRGAGGAQGLNALNSRLAKSGATIKPLFGGLNTSRSDFGVPSLPSASRTETPNLAKFFRVSANDADLDGLANSLRQLDEVTGAYIKPRTSFPALNLMTPRATVAPAKTPDFTGRQKYLDAAPAGVDARYAWTFPGGKGRNVRIIDIEGEWRFTHEDLLNNKGGVVGGIPPNDLGWRNHGTAVIAVFGADENRFGTTGICPEAEVSAISIFPLETVGSAVAIRQAAERLGPGDIILIELHRPGPRHAFLDREDQKGYIPIEWWPDDFDVIRYATSKGIVVVEAGGNGGENLDDSLYDTPQEGFPKGWTNPFRRSNRDSGAIVVGAGAPPPKTHTRDWGPDRSRLDFSNYGAIISAQGWGREVTTCGYGDLQGGPIEDVWYTDEFSGTSSASPVVVGAIGCIQGIVRERKSKPLTPAEVRNLLLSTGSTQTDAPGRPRDQWIGNRPDLRQLISSLGALAPKASSARKSAKRSSKKRAKPKRGK